MTVTTAAGVFIGYTACDVRSQDSELELMLNCAASSDNVINMFSVVQDQWRFSCGKIVMLTKIKLANNPVMNEWSTNKCIKY